MMSTRLRTVANDYPTFSRKVRCGLRHRMRGGLRAAPIATLLITLGAAGSASAQSSCDTLCVDQNADQRALLLPFQQLPDTTAGLAVLQANLQTEENIYLYSSSAQKIQAAEDSLIDYVPQNILIGTFPNNTNFSYVNNVPTAANLPSVLYALPYAVDSSVPDPTNPANDAQLDLKDYFGKYYDTYGQAYGNTTADPYGDPRPFQVSTAIASNPFTVANSSEFAYETQQTNGNGSNQTWGNYTQSPSFPSGHSLYGNTAAIMDAILAPGYYQQFVQEGVDFAYNRNVFGVHYPLDVIGGRILATYVVAQTLANAPLYPSSILPASMSSLSQAMQGYLAGAGAAGGAASPYAAACAGAVAACVANGTIPSAATYAQQIQNYTWWLTYGLPPVGDTTLAPVVPADASVLIASRFPYLTTDQLNAVLASTELPSGGALDNGTGWARLNLYAAASGYGAFPSNVTVTMNAALGGLNAFDIWSNAISGPGGFTLQGSGTLILAGSDTYTGGTSVQGGTLAVTGTLGGNLAIAPGATFVSNGGYAVAANATLSNGGTFIEVNTPLLNAGSASNTGLIVGDVTNSGSFTNSGTVSGAFANAGVLSGNGTVGSLALLAGSTVTPGTIRVLGNLTVAPGATYQVQVGPTGAGLIQVGGTATLSGGTVVVSGIGAAPALGTSWPVLTAAGGVSGSFTTFTAPGSDPAAATRLDMFAGANTAGLAVTPTSYANLGANGLAESRSEAAVGAALDAIRPASGAALDPTQSTLFSPLYALPAGSITPALDELAPSIYADELITARNSWYLVANAISGQLAARRGLAVDQTANTAPGPNGSTIWVSTLAGYNSFGAGNGSPGFTAGLGGAAAGIDMPLLANTARVGIAAGTVLGQTWSQASGNASSNTAQFALYGQWQRGKVFAEAQLGLMYLQESVTHTLPLFGTTAHANPNGLASGGGVRVGMQQSFGAWLIEPSLGFSGFGLHLGHATEISGVPLAETIAGQTLGSAESLLGVSLQRCFAPREGLQITAKARLGWSHEFADNTARVSAGFTGLSGSGFALNSAPIGRDAAVIGLGADIKLASWPLTVFLGYGGTVNPSSNAQSFNAGIRFKL